MSDYILAFKLLDSASLDKSTRQMVSTARSEIKFEHMKTAKNQIYDVSTSCSIQERAKEGITCLESSKKHFQQGFECRGGGRLRGSGN